MAYHERIFILWVLMIFIICAGYKQQVIKEYGFLIIICIIAALRFDFTDNIE